MLRPQNKDFRMSYTNISLLLSNTSTTTAASFPCELSDNLYSRSADLTIGVLHLLAGALAFLGNGVVFFAYFKEASQRASACMFVQLAVAGVLVGFTSTYGGVYLLRGRNHMCQIVENFPHRNVKLPSQHFFELTVGHMWWYGYTCTIMLVTTLSAIRAWSIAKPFKYKLRSSKMETGLLSLACWAFGFLWIGARYLVHCQWLLQTFFTFSVPHCSSNIAYKLLVFPIDVIPILCGTIFTTISNSYVISELAKSYRNPPQSLQTRDTFCKTTLLIVFLTSLFLLCYIPTLLFYFLNSLETLTDYKISFISDIPGEKSFITLFSIKFLIPTLYPALSPALQFFGAYRQREQQRRTSSIFVKMRPSRLNSTFNMWRRATRSTQVLGQSLTLAEDQGQQNSPQFTHTPL